MVESTWRRSRTEFGVLRQRFLRGPFLKPVNVKVAARVSASNGKLPSNWQTPTRIHQSPISYGG